MKIKRFNESLSKNKFVRISINNQNIDVSIEEIENTNAFSRYPKIIDSKYPKIRADSRENALYFGAEEYLIYRGYMNYGDANNYGIDLVDGYGNIIDDEEDFDEMNPEEYEKWVLFKKDVNNYNL